MDRNIFRAKLKQIDFVRVSKDRCRKWVASYKMSILEDFFACVKLPRYKRPSKMMAKLRNNSRNNSNVLLSDGQKLCKSILWSENVRIHMRYSFSWIRRIDAKDWNAGARGSSTAKRFSFCPRLHLTSFVRNATDANEIELVKTGGVYLHGYKFRKHV